MRVDRLRAALAVYPDDAIVYGAEGSGGAGEIWVLVRSPRDHVLIDDGDPANDEPVR